MVLNTKLRLILTTLLLSLFVVGNAITVYYKDTNGWGGVKGMSGMQLYPQKILPGLVINAHEMC